MRQILLNHVATSWAISLEIRMFSANSFFSYCASTFAALGPVSSATITSAFLNNEAYKEKGTLVELTTKPDTEMTQFRLFRRVPVLREVF